VAPPAVFLMVGLQGSGKTTTTAKLARRIARREKKKVLVASLDVYRPAAMEQLHQLASQAEVAAVAIVPGEKPAAIARRALDQARREGFDLLLLDTAGRLAIDEALMAEVAEIRDLAKPHETLLVADAMTGQDAVQTAKGFH
jgi:signal recognition particle subunit SRP54